MSEDKIVKICHQRSAAGFIQFAKDLNDLFAQGYEISTADNMQDCPKFFNRPQVTMIPRKTAEAVPVTQEGVIIESKELSILEQLEVITKKDDLLAFAKEHNIEVPAEVNKPLGIKKLLKEKLQPVESEEGEKPSEEKLEDNSSAE